MLAVEGLKKKSHVKTHRDICIYIYLNSEREQEMKNCDKLRNAEIKKDLRM